MKEKLSTKDLTTMAMFAALITAMAWIPPIPLPFSPVPITLQNFGVFLTAILLGSKKGSMAVLIYTLLGAIGLPVFSGGTGGMGILLGPTGGYLIGFVIAAYLVGRIIESFSEPRPQHYILALIIGNIFIYGIGAFHLAQVLDLSLSTAIKIGVIPYLPLDVVKCVLTIAIAIPVKKRVAFLQA